MQQSNAAPVSMSAFLTADILFACSNCLTPLVVDGAAAGLSVECGNCGQATVVPRQAVNGAAADATKLSDVQHQLKENESQRTEITGYINQLSIQLHRWQLRLQTLNERQQKLESDLSALTEPR